MTKPNLLCLLCAVLLASATTLGQTPASEVRGWLSWRGPNQNGQSTEGGLPEKVSTEAGWTYDLRGRGTPVIANGRVYALGYEGEGKDLEEVLVCLDERTGRRIWEHRFHDFLTDVIYHRFAIGSPTIDPETGNVFCMSTAGLVTSFTTGGELRWQHSMMSEYGRLSFPNGRTGAPLIAEGMCIVHVANSGWGPQAPARDRFFAFDKETGESVWSCTPGGPPKDTSFSFPVVATDGGRRVLYAGLAGGHVVCLDVRSGDPIWRFQLATGGLSMSPVVYKDRIIAIHGKENLDSSTIGRMVAIKRDASQGGKGGAVLGKASELWRNDLVAFTSSPVLVGNRVYQTVSTGDLYCIDADTGEKVWHKKLAPDQIHQAMNRLMPRLGVHSWHLLFPDAADQALLDLPGTLHRQGCQFHWFNRNFASFDDFLAQLTSRKRKSIKRERRQVAEQGITFEHWTGTHLPDEVLDDFFLFYNATYLKRGMRPYLTRDFFALLAQRLGQRLRIITAILDDRHIAAALFVVGEDTLYGRYWGCLDDYHHLHFETCYYQGIDLAIAEGLQRFDAGAQGEHKLVRGFEPVLTHSWHNVAEPGFREAVAHFCEEEAEDVDRYRAAALEALPFRQS